MYQEKLQGKYYHMFQIFIICVNILCYWKHHLYTTKSVTLVLNFDNPLLLKNWPHYDEGYSELRPSSYLPTNSNCVRAALEPQTGLSSD